MGGAAVRVMARRRAGPGGQSPSPSPAAALGLGVKAERLEGRRFCELAGLALAPQRDSCRRSHLGFLSLRALGRTGRPLGTERHRWFI